MIDRLGDGFANENERRDSARARWALACWSGSADEVRAAKAYLEALHEGV